MSMNNKLGFRYYCFFIALDKQCSSAKKFTEMWRRQEIENSLFFSQFLDPMLKALEHVFREAMAEERTHSSKRWRHFLFRWFEVWKKQSVFNIRSLSVCDFKRNRNVLSTRLRCDGIREAAKVFAREVLKRLNENASRIGISALLPNANTSYETNNLNQSIFVAAKSPEKVSDYHSWLAKNEQDLLPHLFNW